MIVRHFAACQQTLDERQAGLRSLAHGDRDSPIQFHYRGRLDLRQPVVKHDDLPPVRGSSRVCLSVNSRNRSLQCVGAEAVRRERLLHQTDPLRYLSSIPEGAILLLEQNQITCRRRPRRTVDS